MSCYYFLRCGDCDVELDERYNHAGAELLELVVERQVLERYAELRRRPGLWPFSVQAENRLEAIAEFLLQHRGHQVRVVDEYGRERD